MVLFHKEGTLLEPLEDPTIIPRSNLPIVIAFAGLGVVGLNGIGWMLTTFSIERAVGTLNSLHDQIESHHLDAAPATTSTTQDQPESSAPFPSFVDVSRAAHLNVPGIAHPELCRADAVELPDDTVVIGVALHAESRAYVVEAFEVWDVNQPEDLAVHVVNDIIGNQPVSITHCNFTHSTRVLTANEGVQGTAPLNVGVAGWENGMLITVDDVVYTHHERSPSLHDAPFLTTTWGDWRRQHPETLVYTGHPCDS